MGNPSLKDKIAVLPLGPGVYLMKAENGEILYIGKAVSLRRRVSSYFQRTNLHGPKIAVMIPKIADIDVIETPSEIDALLLEASLISEYTPRYNTRQKDDKSYPLIKVTHETFPLVTISRNRLETRADYYGPYTDGFLLREALKIIHSIFPIRKCRTLPKTPCLYFHLGQCLAPCIYPEVKPKYDALIGEIKSFLGGGKKSFLDYLTEKMTEAAAEYRYEDAKNFKDQIAALGALKRKKFYQLKPGAGLKLSATQELKRALALTKSPEKIACIDISNIQGAFTVASKVTFYRELPDKNEYRKYRIRTVEGPDDFASIREVVKRFLVGIREGRELFVPDLLMIDGGKGQLSAALEILRAEGFEDVALISIAKKFEWIYRAGSPDPIILEKDSPGLRLLQKIRDEAHRFAISYHRHLRDRSLSRSFLDDIPGLGEARKRMLRQRFGSSEELSHADIKELAGLPGMNPKIAARVLFKILSQ